MILNYYVIAKDIEFLFAELKVTSDIIKEKVIALKPNKSPGLDNLHSNVLSEVASEIATPITAIINKSLEEGNIPQE